MYALGLFDTIGIEYRVSEKYRDFSGIGIDPSIGFWVSKIDTKNALGKMAIVDIEIAKNEYE